MNATKVALIRPRRVPCPELDVSVIQDIYEAFGRGDLPAVLEALVDDVDWFFSWPTDHSLRLPTPREGSGSAVLTDSGTDHGFRAVRAA